MDKAIEYNICSRERDEDGYLYCCSTEKEAMEKAFIELKGSLAIHKGFINLQYYKYLSDHDVDFAEKK